MSIRIKRSSAKAPAGDLALPLYDPVDVHSPAPAGRARRSTVCSEDFRERSAKLRIDLSDDHKGKLKPSHLSPEFRFNAEMSLRVAVGVLIASAIQTRDNDYSPSVEHAKKWALFPSWYYLGGLSYCAVAVIFSAGKNVGGTVKQVCQAFYGVGMALVYNIILFSIVDVRLSESSSTGDPDEGFHQITKTFNSSPYWINTHNFYLVLPWMVLFTVAVVVLPFENNTKKFALGNNLFFALMIINPADPLDSSKLKLEGDAYFDTANILHNLELYFLVGFVGTLISLFTMLVPYPIFAINRLRAETLQAADDIHNLLNIIIDSYCFKNKNVEHMKFLKLKLQRFFAAAEARHQRMLLLLDDAWWEQMFGFNFLLKTNLSMVRHYVTLMGSLIADLKSLSHAMQLEQYDEMHVAYMKVLQREIYFTQTKSGDLLNEISREIHASTERLHLHSIPPLEAQMETTLRKYRSVLVRTLRSKNVSLKDVEGNIPLNLFLFSLESFCRTLIDFQSLHNKKKYGAVKRAVSFVSTSVRSFFAPQSYKKQQVVIAFKVAVAIVMGIFLAVYVYGFSSTTPAAVAYVMGTHIGGSFSITVNRVGGVVAGSVVPSVFQFFISQICDPRYLNIFLSSAALFIWVTISMYVSFSGGYGAYAGLVSAFISAGILLRQSDVCYANGTDSSSSVAISSYSSLAQTSVGIILFILVELAMFPESATSLLRKNIQETLKLQKDAFKELFGHHLSSSSMMMEKDAIDRLRETLQVQVPSLLSEQEKLLKEANSEPLLWRPAFSQQKYEAVLDCLEDLALSNNLLLRLEQWFNYRVRHNGVHLSIQIKDSGSSSSFGGDGEDAGDDKDKQASGARATMSKYEQWATASRQFESAVREKFGTLRDVFSMEFPYSEPDQTALFMQMKEAFRNADRDCSGHIDAHEVATMLELIFAQSGGMREDEIQTYVSKFMEVVDRDASGMVSFEEFMDALERGLKLEVEVYQRRKPKAPALARHGSLGPSLTGHPGGAIGGGNSHLDRIVEETTTTTQTSMSPTTGTSSIAADTAAAVNAAINSMAAASTPKSAPSSPMPVAMPRGPRFEAQVSVPLSPMRREHDILNVDDFSINGIAERMKHAYVVWLLEDERFASVAMEELLLFSCLVSGAEGVALNLTALEKIVASA